MIIAAINMDVQVPLWCLDLGSFNYIPRSGLTGSYGRDAGQSLPPTSYTWKVGTSVEELTLTRLWVHLWAVSGLLI